MFKAARDALGIEDHGGGHHRTGERSPARFVAASHRENAFVERAPLAPESRAEHGLCQWQALHTNFAEHDAANNARQDGQVNDDG